ncbi:MAG: adenosylmethionine decarboxylase [Candidatus Odinarchaeota archaeon]|nr:adenosylmethionine decarboxylase [Candidatus Odinarchaeota archaeon]
MEGLGWHVVAELNGLSFEILNDAGYLADLLKRAIEYAGLTLLSVHTHKYEPQGVTVLAIIAESHLMIHTWPEYGYAAIDIFTCKDEKSTWNAYHYIVNELKPAQVQVMMLKRGLIPPVISSESKPQYTNYASQVF